MTTLYRSIGGIFPFEQIFYKCTKWILNKLLSTRKASLKKTHMKPDWGIVRKTEQTLYHKFSILYSTSIFTLVRKESQIHKSPSVYFLLLSHILVLIHHFITLFTNIPPSSWLVKQVKAFSLAGCQEWRTSDWTSAANAQLRMKLWNVLGTLYREQTRHQSPNLAKTSCEMKLYSTAVFTSLQPLRVQHGCAPETIASGPIKAKSKLFFFFSFSSETDRLHHGRAKAEKRDLLPAPFGSATSRCSSVPGDGGNRLVHTDRQGKKKHQQKKREKRKSCPAEQFGHFPQSYEKKPEAVFKNKSSREFIESYWHRNTCPRRVWRSSCK